MKSILIGLMIATATVTFGQVQSANRARFTADERPETPAQLEVSVTDQLHKQKEAARLNSEAVDAKVRIVNGIVYLDVLQENTELCLHAPDLPKNETVEGRIVRFTYTIDKRPVPVGIKADHVVRITKIFDVIER